MAKRQNELQRKQKEREKDKMNQKFSFSKCKTLATGAGAVLVFALLLFSIGKGILNKNTIEQGNGQMVTHTHVPSCYTEFSVLTCDQEESEQHAHTQSCYEQVPKLTCGMDESHQNLLPEIMENDTDLSISNSQSQDSVSAESTTADKNAMETIDKKVAKEKNEEAERLVALARRAYAKKYSEWNTAIVEKTITVNEDKSSSTTSSSATTSSETVIVGGGMDGVVVGTDTTSVTTTVAPEKKETSKETKTVKTIKKGVDLSALFVSWCIKEAEVDTWKLDNDDYVSGSKVSEVADDLDDILHYAYVESFPRGVEPQMGDLVFLDKDTDDILDIVGIVADVKNGRISYITANQEGEIEEAVVSTDSETVLSFGVLDNWFLDGFYDEETIPSFYDFDENEIEKYLLADLTKDNFTEDPVNIDPNGKKIITAWKLLIQQKDKDGKFYWRDTKTEDFTYEGNEKFQLNLSYYVDRRFYPIDRVDEDGEELNPEHKLYVKLPEYLVGISQEEGSDITQGLNVVGKMYSKGGYAELKFDEDKLDTLAYPVMEGKINAEFYLDASFIPGGGDTLLGDKLNTMLKDNKDLIAKVGKLDIEKSQGVLHTPQDAGFTAVAGYPGAAYLEYDLTVTSMNKGLVMPDVKVLDKVQQGGAKYVLAYAGVDGTEKTAGSIGSVINATKNGVNEGDSKLYLTNNTDPEDKENFATPSGATANAKTDSLVWDIGDMQPDEVRTLKYYIILDRYTGYYHPNNEEDKIKNTATVFAKNNEQDDETEHFVPRSELTIRKEMVGNSYTVDANGDYLIRYKLTVTADPNNAYPMNHVRIYDQVSSGSIEGQYISYVRDRNTYVLRKNDGNPINLKDRSEYYDLPNPKYESNGKGGDKDMTLYPEAPLAPGEYYTLEYTIKIKKEGIITGQSVAKQITNVGEVHDDGNSPLGGKKWGSNRVDYTISNTIWERKTEGAVVPAEDRVINISGGAAYYTKQGNGWNAITAPAGDTFTVPNGSLKYQVVVNESSGWDVSGATISDQLSGSFNNNLLYKFTGWIRVDLFAEGKKFVADPNNPNVVGTDEQALAHFASQTPDRTIWLNVEDAEQFNLTPNDIGVNGNYAYVLTYYTKPNEVGFSGDFKATNDITLSGNVVGVGGNGSYTIPGVHITKNFLTSGTFSYETKKHPWYYQDENSHRIDKVNYPNGEMYWALETKIVGGKLFADTVIRDTAGSNSTLKDSCFLGAFVGPSTEISRGTTFKDLYPSLEYFMADSSMQPLTNLQYATSFNRGAFDLTLKQDLTVGNNYSLYILMRTMPTALPDAESTFKTYYNNMSVKTPGKDFDANTTAYQDVVREYSLDKEPQMAFAVETVDGGEQQFKVLDVDTGAPAETDVVRKLWMDYAPNTSNITGADTGSSPYTEGTYVSWLITVNQDKNMDGSYTLLDTLPDGVELAYVRTYQNEFWTGDYNSGYDSGTRRGSYSLGNIDTNEGSNLATTYGDNASPEIAGQSWTFTGEMTSLGADWKKHHVMSKALLKGYNTNNISFANQNQTLTIYYTKGNQVAIYIPKLQRNPAAHTGKIQFQVVCKVTEDIDKLDQSAYEYKNTVDLFSGQNLDGKSLKKKSAALNLEYPSLSKDMVTELKDGTISIPKLSFAIDVNPYGEKLGDGTHITFLDEMGSSLEFIPNTLRIEDLSVEPSIDLTTVEYTTEFNESGDINILKISVPDGKHLKIHYDVMLNAMPGKPINVSNTAHWEWREAGDIGKSEFEMVYSTGSTIDEDVSLNVSKINNDNISQLLSGAKFKISQIETEEPEDRPDRVIIIKRDENSGEPLVAKEQNTGRELTATLTESAEHPGTYSFVPKSGETIQQLFQNRVYSLEEIEAPAGFKRSKEKIYFIVNVNFAGQYAKYEGNENLDLREAWDTNPVVNISVYNSIGYALVQKSFGDNITPENAAGTYRFGIWSAADVTTDAAGKVTRVDNAKCKAIALISYTEEEIQALQATDENKRVYKSARFPNLRPGDYYIFELEGNTAKLDGQVVDTNGHRYHVGYQYTNDDEIKNDDGSIKLATGNKVTVGEATSPEVPMVRAQNSIYKIAVLKKFADANGEDLPTGMPGTYQFGLWSQDKTEASGVPTADYINRPDQVKTIEWSEEDTAASHVVEFEGLETNKNYYVYELKDGRPVFDRNTATINGIQFYVVYSDKDGKDYYPNSTAISVPQVHEKDSIDYTVTNTALVSLPETGGIGTKWFTIGGLLLIGLAGVLFAMKKWKKMWLFLLCMSFTILAYGNSVDAAGKSYTIRIENEKENHEYTAYQIFKGELLDADGQTNFTGIQWGKNIEQNGFLAALKADSEFNVGGYNLFEACEVGNPAGVIERLSLCNKMQLVAKHAANHLKDKDLAKKTSDSVAGVYQMTVSEAGYYLFIDTVKTGTALSQGDSISSYMMNVVESVTIRPKSQEIPTIEKKVLNNNDSESAGANYVVGDPKNTVLNALLPNQWIDAADYDIGDEIIFRIKVDLPSNGDLATGLGGGFELYDNYHIKVLDTIPDGLDYMPFSLVAFIGNGTVTAGYRDEITRFINTADGHDAIIDPAGIHVTSPDNDNGNVLTIEINNVKASNIAAQGGESILFFYKCRLKENAKIGSAGNTNSVKMQYSNNPSDSQSYGETPEDKNTIFTYSFRINKVGENRTPLSGADFRLDKLYASYTLAADSLGIGEVAFYDDDFRDGKGRIWFDGESVKYYKNTITKEVVKRDSAPGDNWTLVPTVSIGQNRGNVWVEQNRKAVTASGAAQKSVFTYKGLDEGNYLISEVVTPENYNSIEPIPFSIASSKTQDPGELTLESLTVNGLQGATVNKDSGETSIEVTIENNKGSRLPSTGGVGTTLIYIVGALLVLGAGIAFSIKLYLDRR